MPSRTDRPPAALAPLLQSSESVIREVGRLAEQVLTDPEVEIPPAVEQAAPEAARLVLERWTDTVEDYVVGALVHHLAPAGSVPDLARQLADTLDAWLAGDADVLEDVAGECAAVLDRLPDEHFLRFDLEEVLEHARARADLPPGSEEEDRALVREVLDRLEGPGAEVLEFRRPHAPVVLGVGGRQRDRALVRYRGPVDAAVEEPVRDLGPVAPGGRLEVALPGDLAEDWLVLVFVGSGTVWRVQIPGEDGHPLWVDDLEPRRDGARYIPVEIPTERGVYEAVVVGARNAPPEDLPRDEWFRWIQAGPREDIRVLWLSFEVP